MQNVLAVHFLRVMHDELPPSNSAREFDLQCTEKLTLEIEIRVKVDGGRVHYLMVRYG